MIMRRLTPEDAVKAFLEHRQMYTIEQIEYGTKSMDEFLELVEANALVTFEDAPAAEKEPAEEGRTETTATEQGAPAEAVEKPKQARKEINVGWIITLRNEGKSAKEIAAETGYSIQSVYRYMGKKK